MLYIITLSLFFFNALLGTDSYDFYNASIDVLPFHEDLVYSDVYIRPFNDVDSKFQRYFFKFSDFPKDEDITVSIQRIAQKDSEAWRPIYKFSIRGSGMIVENGNPIGFMLCFSAQGCLPGERISFMFEAESGFKKGVSFIPNPLTLKSRKGNALLKAELLSLDPTFFRIEFPGLKPKENVKIYAESLGICQEPIKHNASEALIFSPDIKGQGGGVALLTVARRTSQKFKLEIPWGTEILKSYAVPMFFRP